MATSRSFSWKSNDNYGNVMDINSQTMMNGARRGEKAESSFHCTFYQRFFFCSVTKREAFFCQREDFFCLLAFHGFMTHGMCYSKRRSGKIYFQSFARSEFYDRVARALSRAKMKNVYPINMNF